MKHAANRDEVMTADAGTMRQFTRYAKVSGLSLDDIFDDDLREILALSETQDRIPAHGIVDALEVCAAAARRPALGIEFANWTDLHGFGVLCLLWDHCPTMAELLRINARYLHVESDALNVTVERQGDEVMIRHMLAIPAHYGGTQFIESTMMLSIRIMRMIMGEKWAPVRIELEHPEPIGGRRHLSPFGCDVQFGAERSAYFVRPRDLNTPSVRGNAQLLDYLERQIGTLEEAHGGTVSSRVSQLVTKHLSSGRATLEHISTAAGMTPRTLQRRLAEEGAEFSLLLEQVRKQIAEQYALTERKPQLTRLAFRLGYSEASAASRFLRRQFGAGLRELVQTIRASAYDRPPG
ncbi:AraC family transcriptional regulator [Burkholderia sp. Bp9142]|uniref:AraC family transcriptional regulator n=1 Tax=Burkholderia sp. Bp9142 TaxID=2184573 RepID=UPI000F5B5CB7|nr:AraC family transcriptional regulator [Burkholderia sp. Bp9142]RQR33220.1 AraC family transcriptional regulator [Burkholderia sp. Bp9142]